MSLEQKLNENEIKKILIVDDTQANIEAAKQYFEQVEKLGVKVEYASNAKEAKEKIKSAYEAKEKYSMVLSDLTMEEPKSGLEVVSEAYRHFGRGFIVTGYNYDNPGHGHGPLTSVYPMRGCGSTIRGKKEDSAVWGAAFEYALEYLEAPHSKALTESMQRYETFVRQPMADYAIDLIMIQFRDLTRQ